MAYLPSPRVAALSLLMLASLGGCLTPQAKTQTSQAVLEARARRHAPPVAGCPQVPLAQVSPVTVGFAFDDATLPDLTASPLLEAAHWLTCNASVAVVIKPDSDPQGAAAQKDALALRRAQAVQGYLTSQGVAPARIRLLARDAAEPAGEHLLVLAEGRRW
jgi:outer membrane protein OmpA-like peptidoglycan-associated protein